MKYESYEQLEKHGDFARYWCRQTKREYWLLGYFGGGAINVSAAMSVAKIYAEKTGCDVDDINIDEIQNSRWCKYFKCVYNQKQGLKKPSSGKIRETDNAWELFRS